MLVVPIVIVPTVELTKDLPGDIVELGVFKGSGVATFLKFIEIFCTHSNKKIIGALKKNLRWIN